MRYKVYITIICLCSFISLHAQVENSLYKKVIDLSLDETVPFITVNKLKASRLGNYIFLDTRAKEEFSRSHLDNAFWIGYDDFKSEKLPQINTNDTIILYCSIGYRSEKVGEKLLALGYKNVFNLYGGIFEWVNQGMPVYNIEESPTDTVHAYSPEWGIWLNKGVKVYE